MNDDYLWDRTGEPDPEIQQLEDVLGALRYQPKALELPPGIQPKRVRSYFRPLAVAAAIAFLVLAAGLWIRVNRPAVRVQNEVAGGSPAAIKDQKVQPVTASSPSPIPPPVPLPVNEQLVNAPDKPPKQGTIVRHRTAPLLDNGLAKNRNRQPNSTTPWDDLSVAQLDEARAAKEQLMLALRLASAKLSLAQRKTQTPPAPGTIRNQHKFG